MQSLSNRKGMTFLEVLIAMVIFGAILFAFMSTFGYGFTTIFSQGEKTRAVADAQALIDFVQNRDAFISGTFDIKDDVLDAFDNSEYIETYANVETMAYNGSEIVFSVASKSVGSVDSVAMHEITVRVFYQEGKNSVTIKALLPPKKI